MYEKILRNKMASDYYFAFDRNCFRDDFRAIAFRGKRRGHWKKEGMKQYMLERFSKELHLSAEQKNQVSAIFEKRHPQMLALQAEMRPKFETLRNATDAEIRALLNADQQKKFDEIHAKMEARWKGHEKFPAPK